jgi:hypothetical protein
MPPSKARERPDQTREINVDTSKQMPDLMGAGHAAPGGADGNRRILAHLEHGARPSAHAIRARAWDIDGWTVGLIVLLLTMSGIAWLMHEETITPISFNSPRSSTRLEAATAPASAPLARPADTQAAAIINMPHALPAAPPPPQATATTRPIADKTANHKTASGLRPKASAGTPAEPPAAASDADVTLLTALVAHAGKPASVAPERTRDVVQRHDGDRTADLLARCRQLGLMEGMLCRSRICAGSWEADPACRAPAN